MFNANLPLCDAQTLPFCSYGQPAEQFLNGWLFVGYKHQVQHHGSYFTTQIENRPIVVLNNEGKISSFYNVCRHKATTLLKDEGFCSKIRCPYHGWTYDLNGELKGTPEFKANNFDKKLNGLIEFQTECLGNLIFIKDLPSKGPKSLLEFLHPIGSSTEPKFTIPDYIFSGRKKYNIKCDWKVFIDNYLDGGYHVNYVHEKLASAIDYKEYKTEIYPNSVLQVTPLKESELEDIKSTRKGDYAYYWWIYPNLMINIYGPMMDINIVLPTPAGTEVLIDFFRHPDESMSSACASILTSDEIQIEDVKICERVQTGINAGIYSAGRFGEREEGIYHFHKLYEASRKLV